MSLSGLGGRRYAGPFEAGVKVMRTKFLALAALASVFTGTALAGAGAGWLKIQVKNLDAVKLELKTIASDGDASQMETPRFEPGHKVRFRLVATNNSSEVVNVPLTNPYYQNRPRLRGSGGDELPYRGDVAKLVKAKDDEAVPTYISSHIIPLRPYEQRELETIDLSAWYHKLKPGVYELTVGHRFERGGAWVAFSPITFEVVKAEDNPGGPEE